LHALRPAVIPSGGRLIGRRRLRAVRRRRVVGADGPQDVDPLADPFRAAVQPVRQPNGRDLVPSRPLGDQLTDDPDVVVGRIGRDRACHAGSLERFDDLADHVLTVRMDDRPGQEQPDRGAVERADGLGAQQVDRVARPDLDENDRRLDWLADADRVVLGGRRH